MHSELQWCGGRTGDLPPENLDIAMKKSHVVVATQKRMWKYETHDVIPSNKYDTHM